MRQRKTNIDVEVLARSPLVAAFMLRTLDDLRDPLTGHVFAVLLAQSAADAFDLWHEDKKTFARALLDVAERVLSARDSPAASGR